MRRREEELQRLNVEVAVVTFEEKAAVERYLSDTGLSWPILLDAERSLYAAYEIERGGVWDVWGPASWGTYLKLLLKGRRLRKPTGDVQQLGGDVLVDPQGVVRLRHVTANPADRPEISSILQLVREADGR